MSYVINAAKCVNCRRCVEKCPTGAPRFDGETYQIREEMCIDCGTCARGCPMNAIHEEGYIPPAKPARRTGDNAVLVRKCDFAVIGAGPAGLVAACKAAEAGYQTIILEALDTVGGAGRFATFMRLFDTKWEKDMGLPEQMEDYIRAGMNTTHWKLDHSLVRNAFHSIPAWLDWFCTFADADNGFRYGMGPFGTGVTLKDNKTPQGPFVVSRLLKHCEELGVEILTCHRAKKLLFDENREKIAGVLADDPAGETRVECSAVLIATGNMANSSELKRFLPEYAQAVTVRSAHRLDSDNGDGIRMVEEAGIPVDTDGVASHYLGAMPAFFDEHVLQQGLRCEGVRVSLEGRRFVSESLDRFEAVNQLIRQPKCLSFNIIDSAILNQEILPTIKLPIDPGGNIGMGLPQPGKPMPTVDFMGFPIQTDEDGKPVKTGMEGMEESRGMGEYEEGSRPDPEKLKEYTKLKGGHVCVADSIEELAEQMGVPADTLKETIERYNEMCRNGIDEDFSKYPRYMFPIEKAPFYAFKCFLGTDGVFGGIFIDDRCRVKNGEKPVKGLFAAGDVTSGNYVNAYERRSEVINDFTWANASGFLAGGSAAEYLAESGVR